MDEQAPDTSAEELRHALRFLLEPPLEGTFNGEPVRIFNIGEEGLQIELRHQIRESDAGEILFSLPATPRLFRVSARVRWCHAAKDSSRDDAWPYRCGLEVEGMTAATLRSLGELVELELARADTRSLERRKQLLQQPAGDLDPRLPRAASPPALNTLGGLVEAVRGALAELTREPGTIHQLAEAGRRDLRKAGEPDEYVDEVLAVWEYLHRCTAPRMIAMVFDLDPGT